MIYRLICFIIFAVLSFANTIEAKEFDEVRALQTRLPYEEATSFKGNVVKHGISLAAHPLNKEECEKYFSYDLNGDGYLPVKIVLTNTSALRLLVHGSDVELTAGKQTFTPLPSSELILKIQDDISIPFFNVSKEEYYNEDAIRKNAIFVNFNQKGLGYRILEPNQSVSGIAFFNSNKLPKKDLSVRLRVQDLGRVRYLSLEAVLH